jgi:hypothetical protein
MMRTNVRYALFALLAVVPLSAFASRLGTPLEVQPDSRLWVKGTSTVRAFECKATSLLARVDATAPEAVKAVLAGEKAVGAVAVRLDSDRLDCNNGTMNSHMLKAIKAKEHPAIVFTLNSYALQPTEQGMTVTLDGTLDLGGTQKPVSITAEAKGTESGGLRVLGAHELKLSDYGLKAPTLMLGTMRVHDKVTVGFDIVLKD